MPGDADAATRAHGPHPSRPTGRDERAAPGDGVGVVSLLTENDAAGVSVVAAVPRRRAAEPAVSDGPQRRRYFTLVYGVADLSSGQFQCVMAGHPARCGPPRTGSAAPVAARGSCREIDRPPSRRDADASPRRSPCTAKFGRRHRSLERRRRRVGLHPTAGRDRPLARPSAARRPRPHRRRRSRWSGQSLKDDISLIAIERTGPRREKGGHTRRGPRLSGGTRGCAARAARR